ncbi:MAG: hypothetical protein KDD55_09880, partial [Bdellovibrionales bacterium]|nr:hypothetical protein [Bdellovibrionales bacterium]
MFSTELSYTLEAAFREASTRHHQFFCLEHLLYALLFDGEIQDVIVHCGGDVQALRNELENFFKEHLDSTAVNESHGEPIQTPAVQRVLQRAIIHMHSSGKEFITGKDVFIALYGEEESHAVYFLLQQEITRLDAINYISHGVSQVDEDFIDEDD